MKTITTRDLNRKTASVLDALERGETFELRRNGKAVGFLVHASPPPERKPDWKAHTDWLKRQPQEAGRRLLAEFDEDRRRLRSRDQGMGNLA